MHNLWSARKEAIWAMCSQRAEGTQIWSTDVAVPLSQMPEIIGGCHLYLVGGSLLILHARSLKARVRGPGSIL